MVLTLAALLGPVVLATIDHLHLEQAHHCFSTSDGSDGSSDF